MPSKALLRPAQVLAEAARVPGATQAISGGIDPAAVLARRDEIVNNLDDSQQVPWLEGHGVELIRDRGRLDGKRRVRVGDAIYEARIAVVVAVGSTAAIPPIPGIEDVGAWTNREITSAQRVPPRLLIVGGGVVGVEMADAFNSLGSSVVLIEPSDRLIGREEEFASEELREALSGRGVDIRLRAQVAEVGRQDGVIRATLSDGARVESDEILLAAGRLPLAQDLGLETVGLSPGRHIDVDNRLQVPEIPWLYAIGDVNGRSLLTHMGKWQAHVASEVLGGGDSAGVDEVAGAPRVIFTEPEIAAVGLSLQAATDSGRQARAYDVPTSGTAGASFYGRNVAGTSRIVVDEERGVIVGATFVGTDVADWLQAATIAIVSCTPIELVWQAVPAFPTRSEVWLKLLERRAAAIELEAGAELANA